MALVDSISLPLNTRMPDFDLLDPEGNAYSLSSLLGEQGLLIAFTCNHCPYAIAIWGRLIRLSIKAEELGVTTVAINPNIHPSYPEDSPEAMKLKIREWDLPFPYLVDETQDIARAYQAQCTPDLYLLNNKKELVYHGQLDDNWQNEKAVTRYDLNNAIVNLVNGEPISSDQHPSMGCSIKWL